MLNENVDDKDLNLDVNDKSEDKSNENEENGDEKEKADSWKDKQTVPYRRLEATSRKAQKLEEELNDLKGKFEALTQKPSDKPKGVWDNKIKNANSWDEVFDELPQQFLKALSENPEMKSQLIKSFKTELKNEEKQVEEKVNIEIEDLWDKDIITSKDQENRVIKYAIKESEESGEYIPLAVAVRMMKKEGVWDKKIEDRKEANSKVRPGGSGGNSKGEKTNYGRWKHESVDTIISNAASKFDK